MPSQSRSARQLPRKRGSQNETFRLLPPTRAGEVARRAGEGNNKQCGGRFLRTSPRRGTLSFVMEHLNQQGLTPASSLYQSRYGAAGIVISTVLIRRGRC